jgi:hypothetical protein
VIANVISVWPVLVIGLSVVTVIWFGSTKYPRDEEEKVTSDD